MKGTGWAAAVVVAVMGIAAAAQDTKTAQDTNRRVIVVSLEERKLALVEDGQVTKIYSVAVGKPSTPSPVGTFTIERRVANPVYHHDGKTVQPGPGNPVGTRWMGLSVKGYGIHGTNAPKSIGKAASHGCIRMAEADLEELFAKVREGDTVELIGEPNEETAQVFGTNELVPPASAQPVLSAHVPAAAGPLGTGMATGLAVTAEPAPSTPAADMAKLTAAAGGTH